MATTNSASQKTKILPWQMAVLVIAIALVLWKLLSYVGEQRALANVKNDPGDYASKLVPGSVRQQREMEK